MIHGASALATDSHNRVKQLFAEAMALPAESRTALLRSRCGGDRHLYDEVVSLIDSYERAGNFFERPLPVGFSAGSLSVTTRGARAIEPGRRLGPYLILDSLGSGGMGEVY